MKQSRQIVNGSFKLRVLIDSLQKDMLKRSSNKFNIIAIIIAFLIVSDGLKYIYWNSSFWHPFIKLTGLLLLCILPVVIPKKKNPFR